MMNVRVARRYAEAFVEITEGQKFFDAVAKDLGTLRQSIGGSREFLLFLKSPLINKARKQEVLRILFAGKLQTVTLGFLAILAEKGREELLPDVIDQFFAIWDERQGIINVGVKSATVFSDDQTAALKKKLEIYTNKKVRMSFSLDKQLRGGFVARVGDTVFDGSVKRQLELLRERFVEGNGGTERVRDLK